MRKAMVVAVTVLLLACAPAPKRDVSAKLLGGPDLPRTEVDGVTAVLHREPTPNFVALDLVGSVEDRAAHEALALRAAETLSGCKAAKTNGGELDYIVAGAKPVRVAVALTC